MAQKIQTFFIDDLDGSEAEGTVLFGLDGTQYEIDLSTGHAKELRTALARYIDAGRRVTGTARRGGLPAAGQAGTAPGPGVLPGRLDNRGVGTQRAAQLIRVGAQVLAWRR